MSLKELGPNSFRQSPAEFTFGSAPNNLISLLLPNALSIAFSETINPQGISRPMTTMRIGAETRILLGNAPLSAVLRKYPLHILINLYGNMTNGENLDGLISPELRED